jgi:hypothetical protein
MEEFKDKYDSLISKGYLIELYEQDREYGKTGIFHAFCISIMKDGKNVLNHFSRKSYREALIVAS